MSYPGIPQGYMVSNPNISKEIREEIRRFESVHPSIYAIYDLIEGITDLHLQNQIREHVVNIEDSFVNSQEWTISRDVPDLKLGIIGLVNSGKSALVHRYLTGSYMQEESPEGGRFKKEVQVDGHSYLLLIRDEGGVPEAQFTNWVDVVVLVFSVVDELSFNGVRSYYNKMCHYREMSHMPIILVGTQDAIDGDHHKRVIDESKAKQLEAELGSRCRYYETCATYGLNVDYVFQDACQRAVQEKVRLVYNTFGRTNGTTATRSHSANLGHYASPRVVFQQPSSRTGSLKPDRSDLGSELQQGPIMRDNSNSSVHRHDRQQRVTSGGPNNYASSASLSWSQHQSPVSQHVSHPNQLALQSKPVYSSNSSSLNQSSPHERQLNFNDLQQELEALEMADHSSQLSVAELTPMLKRKVKKISSAVLKKSNSFHGVMDKKNPTPNSTPVMSRKKKHTPSIFGPYADTNSLGFGSISTTCDSGTDNLPTPASTPTQARKNRRRSNIFPRKDDNKTDELGSGRAIPIKQGFLYKKGSKGITKDWKKKYVTLTSGKLIYHPNIHDYMEDVHGKAINLIQTTVKIPGQNKPRLNSQFSNMSNGNGSDQTGDSINESSVKVSPRDLPGAVPLVPDVNGADNLNNSVAGVQAAKIESTTPHTRRKHRRAKSGSKIEANGDGNDSDGYEFTIVSLDNKQWQFEAPTQEERDTWVTNIEKQIFSSLQGNTSQRKSCQDPNAVLAIRNMPGNNVCSDCGLPNPSWASLNLGSLICIECSGIHRNLGTHHSRVRSLELDEWPPDLTAVMLAIGNQRSNSIWEHRAPKQRKPSPSSSREEKEQWIRAKYELKEYLPERPHKNIPLSHLLIDAIARQELSQVILLLADSNPEEVSTPYSGLDRRTPLHIAAQQANPIFLQLLLWYGADVKKLDQEGRSALWYAKQVGSKDCAQILSSNGCPDSSTLPRLRRGSLRTPLQNDKSKDRTSINSTH